MCTLNDVGVLKRGVSKHRPRNDERLFDGDYPFIQTGDVKSAKWKIREYSQTYNEFGLSQSRLWKKGTLCITIAANIAETAILDIDACFPDSVLGFKANEDLCNFYYIEYMLRNFKNKLVLSASQTAQKNINLGTFERAKFPLPDKETQDKIVSKIIPFDLKIESNEKEMAILEEYSELLFHKWFVEPDENGKLFEDTVGEITTSDFCYKVSDGTHETPKPVEEGYHLVTSKHIANGKLNTSSAYFISKSDYIEVNKRSQVKQWDILFSMIGSVGEVYLEANPSPQYAIKNLGLFKMNGDKEKAIKLYYYLKYPYFQKTLRFRLSGSIQSFVPLQFLRNIKLPRKFDNNNDSDKVLFESLGLIVDKLYCLRKENEILEETRDLLIKKLIK